MGDFIYERPFQIQKDPTSYRLLSTEFVKTVESDGRKILRIDPKGLELLAKTAVSDLSFYLRTSHLEKLRKIIDDPEATSNDRFLLT
jgi:fumarate hydratase class I